MVPSPQHQDIFVWTQARDSLDSRSSLESAPPRRSAGCGARTRCFAARAQPGWAEDRPDRSRCVLARSAPRNLTGDAFCAQVPSRARGRPGRRRSARAAASDARGQAARRAQSHRAAAQRARRAARESSHALRSLSRHAHAAPRAHRAPPRRARVSRRACALAPAFLRARPRGHARARAHDAEPWWTRTAKHGRASLPRLARGLSVTSWRTHLIRLRSRCFPRNCGGAPSTNTQAGLRVSSVLLSLMHRNPTTA